MRANIDANTVALIGSACNYGYGTIDPITELGALALEHGIGLHVDGCLGGFILPFGREFGYDIPPFDFSVPGVTTISADTHKYGYALKGTSVLAFADQSLRNAQYFYLTDWSRREVLLAGHGRLAFRWTAGRHLGRDGQSRARGLSALRQGDLRDVGGDAGRRFAAHPSLRIMGQPSFLFSFTSDEFDIYLVNDFLRTRGWRMNGQQYPNAHAHGGHPAPDPAGRRRAVGERPRRRRRLRAWRTATKPAKSGRHLRRRRGRHERRGRRVHPCRHGRHDGSAGIRFPLHERRTLSQH